MERLSVYVETTIPSALYSVRSDPFSLAAQESTRVWWEHRREDFDLCTSEAVEQELRRGSFPKQPEMLEWLVAMPKLELTPTVEGLARLYANERLVPRLEVSLDAVHLAAACFYGCDILLILNIRHLANPNKVDHLAAINFRTGMSTPRILTPEFFSEP